MSIRSIAQRVWRFMTAADLPADERQALAEWSLAVRLTGDPTAAALLAAQIRAARIHTATEGAPMPHPTYRRLVDHLRTFDGDVVPLSVEIVGPDEIHVTAHSLFGHNGGAGYTLTAAQLDEVIDALDGALAAFTPRPDPHDTDAWDDIAESMVTRLAADPDNALTVASEIALLQDDDRHALTDALVIRAAAILGAFRDHVTAGHALVTAANRDPAIGLHPATNDYRQWRNDR